MKVKKDKRLVQGIGINDADYNVQEMINLGMVNGKRKNIRVWTCPFYAKWCHMLARCNPKHQVTKWPSYKGVSVCEDWIYFSKFRSWMENQNYEGLHLDKDILIPDSKLYSPDTCVFVPDYINMLFTQSDRARGEYPLGVSRDKIPSDMKNYLKNSYRASIRNRDKKSGRMQYLGGYPTPGEAHKAWQLAKIDNIISYIERYREESCYLKSVEDSLMLRVYQLQNDIENNQETTKL